MLLLILRSSLILNLTKSKLQHDQLLKSTDFAQSVFKGINHGLLLHNLSLTGSDDEIRGYLPEDGSYESVASKTFSGGPPRRRSMSGPSIKSPLAVQQQHFYEKYCSQPRGSAHYSHLRLLLTPHRVRLPSSIIMHPMPSLFNA